MRDRGHDDDTTIAFYIPLSEQQEAFREGVEAAIVAATNAVDYHPAFPQAQALDAMLQLYRQAENGIACPPAPWDMMEAADRVIHRRARSTRTSPGMVDRLDRARAFFRDLEHQAQHVIRQRRYNDLEARGVAVLARHRKGSA
jgi:hypothetical protein